MSTDARLEDDRGIPQRGSEQPPPRFAQGILCFVLVGFLLQVSVNLSVARPGRSVILVGVVCFAAIDAIQMVHSLPQARSFRRRYGLWTLGLQTLLTYLPIILFGRVWGAAGGFLAGSALLVLPPVTSYVMFALVSLSIPLVALKTHDGLQNTVYTLVSTMIIGLMIYGLSRLTGLVAELHRARGQLAKMAVAQERLRFARDLHDLLGYSLSAITLKSEVAIRLVPNHQGRAVDELTSILEISRQALSDVRAIASSYRDMSLAREVEAAEAMLTTAEIEVEAHVSCPPLASPVDTVLATVLREAVTNMLRHSKVQRCRIEVAEQDGRIRLTIVNDGVTGGPAAGTPSRGQRLGSGLGNLESRVAAIGGRLTAGVRVDGHFQVLAETPTVPTGTPTAVAAEELPEAA